VTGTAEPRRLNDNHGLTQMNPPSRKAVILKKASTNRTSLLHAGRIDTYDEKAQPPLPPRYENVDVKTYSKGTL